MLIADIMYQDHGHGWIQYYQGGQLVIFHFNPCRIVVMIHRRVLDQTCAIVRSSSSPPRHEQHQSYFEWDSNKKIRPNIVNRAWRIETLSRVILGLSIPGRTG